jgi:peptidoglycan hydrolase-like protein with peptidoglycan-binding domain
MQEYLTALSSVYPSIPRLAADGIFGPATQNAVIAFQRLFGLSADGVIGPITWNAIVTQYNRLPTSPPITSPPYPGTPLRQGSTGENVRVLQTYINRLADRNSSVPRVTVDGIFGPATRAAVIAAQRALGLAADGIVGPITWNAVVR